MACVAPGGRRFRFPLQGATVSRRAFDKALAARAEGAGAELRFPCGVSRVTDDAVEFVGGGKVRGEGRHRRRRPPLDRRPLGRVLGPARDVSDDHGDVDRDVPR